MLTRRARRTALLCALALLVLGASALVTASSTRRAAASCTGSTNKVLSRYTATGTLVAREAVAFPGTTCNGDYQYSGAVLDPITDGSCAYAYYSEPLAYYALQGVSCTTGVWNAYGYSDAIGTNSVFVSVRPSYLTDIWVLSNGY